MNNINEKLPYEINSYKGNVVNQIKQLAEKVLLNKILEKYNDSFELLSISELNEVIEKIRTPNVFQP